MQSQLSNKELKSDEKFLTNYWTIYKKILFDQNIDKELISLKNAIAKVSLNKGKLFLVGNGASASLASHAATDFTKQAKVQALAFNDHNLITALANDYGYENWVSKALDFYVTTNDLVIFISVSGTSKNLVNAMENSRKSGIKTASLTGSDINNPLKKNCDFSLWVDSKAYNIVEAIHTIYMTTIIDLIIGKYEYSVN